MRLRSSHVFVLALLLCSLFTAHAQKIPISGGNVQDLNGNSLASGQICFAPVNNNGSPIGFHMGGGGWVPPVQRCTPVTAGAFSTTIADTANTYPINVCFYTTVQIQGVGNATSSYVVSPCLQPSETITSSNSSWCTTGGCNLDNYLPSGTPGAVSAFPGIGIGTVTALSPGSTPTVTNVGNAINAVLNFGLTTGNTGAQGIPGPPSSYQGTYSATTTYSAGQTVLSGTTYYTSLTSGNLNNTPSSSPTDWTAAPTNLPSALYDTQGNLLLSNTVPTAGFPLPTGYQNDLLVGAGAGSNIGNGTGLTANGGLIAIGQNACHLCRTNNGSVVIGQDALGNSTGNNTAGGEDTNSVVIGPNAGLEDGSTGCPGGTAHYMFESVLIGNKAADVGCGFSLGIYIGSHIYSPHLDQGSIVIGGEALYQPWVMYSDLITSNNSTFVGANIMSSSSGAGDLPSNTTFINGNLTVVGASAAPCMMNTQNNTLIGAHVTGGAGTGGTTPCGGSVATASDNIFIGDGRRGPAVNITSALANVIVGGNDSGPHSAGDALSSGSSNTVVGAGAAQTFSTASNMAVFGFQAAKLATAQTDAYGSGALAALTTGAGDAAFGFQSCSAVTTGQHVVCFGPGGGSFSTANDIVVMGYHAANNDNASQETYLGSQAGRRNATALSGTGNNTGIGYEAFTSSASAGGGEINDTAIGALSNCYGCQNSEMLGEGAITGDSTHTGVVSAAEIGQGTNNVSHTLQFNTYNFLDDSGNAEFNTISQGVGSVIASAATIAPVKGITHISGTAAISTITVPTVLSGGGTFTGCLEFIPNAAFTLATGGNIATATTAVVGKVMTVCYDGTSWYPSY